MRRAHEVNRAVIIRTLQLWREMNEKRMSNESGIEFPYDIMEGR